MYILFGCVLIAMRVRVCVCVTRVLYATIQIAFSFRFFLLFALFRFYFHFIILNFILSLYVLVDTVIRKHTSTFISTHIYTHHHFSLFSHGFIHLMRMYEPTNVVCECVYILFNPNQMMNLARPFLGSLFYAPILLQSILSNVFHIISHLNVFISHSGGFFVFWYFVYSIFVFFTFLSFVYA